MKAFTRIGGILLRYLYLHTRSLPRLFEIFFWPVMELLVWGFTSVYFQSMMTDPSARLGAILLSAIIFWDILYRSQQAVSIAVVEDIWTQNIVNVLVSPLRLWEWLGATFIYGFLKISAITLILTTIAYTLYHFNLYSSLGLAMIPLLANLLLFGWALGVFTSALVIRWGHSAEALVWGIPYLVQPISAIYYPVSVLPKPLQAVSRCLPSTYVFEGIREVTKTGVLPMSYFWSALGLNLVYFLLAGIFFAKMFAAARNTGRLGRLGMD